MSHDLRESDLDYDPAGDVVDVDTDDNDDYGSAEEHRALSHRAPSEHLASSSTSEVDQHVTVTERPSVVRPSSPTRSATPPPHGASDIPSSGSVRPATSGSSGLDRTRSSRVESLRVGNVGREGHVNRFVDIHSMHVVAKQSTVRLFHEFQVQKHADSTSEDFGITFSKADFKICRSSSTVTTSAFS